MAKGRGMIPKLRRQHIEAFDKATFGQLRTHLRASYVKPAKTHHGAKKQHHRFHGYK